MLKVLLEHLVHPFGLTVCLRIVTQREVNLDVEECAKRPEELRGKFRTSIARNVKRDTVLSEYMV